MTPEKNRAQAQSLLQSTPLMNEVMQDLITYDAYLTTRMTNDTVIMLVNGIARKNKNVYTFKVIIKDCQIDNEKIPKMEIKNGDVRKVLLLSAMLTNCTITMPTDHGDVGFVRVFKLYSLGEEITGNEQVISFLELLGHVKRLLKQPVLDYINGPKKSEV